jgi:hypothetical protein
MTPTLPIMGAIGLILILAIIILASVAHMFGMPVPWR